MCRRLTGDYMAFKPKRISEEAVEEAVQAAEKKGFDASKVQRDIAKLLKYSTFEPERRYWLDTGNPNLNATLGSEKLGLPYGKVWEVAGRYSGGKTAIVTVLAGMAQRDEAGVGRIDFEQSRDSDWEGRLGLDASQVVTIYPKLVVKSQAIEAEDAGPISKYKAKKKKKKHGPGPVLQGAESLFTEAEIGMEKMAAYGFKKQFWFIDSIATLQPEMVLAAGTAGQNMRTNNERAVFLSNTLPKWAGLAANYNAMVFLINQVRTKPGVMFGDPTYTPGGNSLGHTCSVMARVSRLKELKRNGRTAGIVSVISNIKNKAGGGSVEREKCGFKIYWRTSPAKIEFGTKEEAEAWAK